MPLWEEIEALAPTKDLNSFFDREFVEEDLKALEEDTSKYIDEFMANRNARDLFIYKLGWAIPNPEAIETIKKFVGTDFILEVCSGLGMWARLLMDEGVSIVASDRDPEWISPIHKMYEQNLSKIKRIRSMNVLKAEAVTALRIFYPDVLMMIWPPYDRPVAKDALDAFKGNKFIYVGEGSGGCTGTDDFHDQLEEEWDESEVIHIPQWEHIHDNLFLYTRKENT